MKLKNRRVASGQSILGLVSSVASSRQTELDVSWSFIEGRIHQKTLSELRQSGDIDNLFDEAMGRINSLEEQNRDLENRVREEREQHEKARNEAEAYKRAYIETKKATAGRAADATAIELVPPTTVGKRLSKASRASSEKKSSSLPTEGRRF